jgi:amino-acid N-acetyltransferase
MKRESGLNARELQPTDLRGILKYVPQWRNHTFIIALDGAVVDDDNFGNIMLELAVLRNLGIRIVVVHGIGNQLQRLSAARGVPLSDTRGYGPTDGDTLQLAAEAAAVVGHRVQRGLTQNGLKCALTNAVRATPRGIIGGVDQLFSGKVDKVDIEQLQRLLELEIVPVVSPVCFTRDGTELRINSDSLASELARHLRASKLIFLLPYPGLTIRGEFRLNADLQEIRQLLVKDPQAIDEPVRSKAQYAVRTIEAGTPRAHIIDCRIHDGILLEVFSKVGIGSMIHSNPYSQIRPARRKDVTALYTITKSAVRDEALRSRSRQSIEQAIGEYFVYEIDDSVIGCFRLTAFPRSRTVELSSVFVHPAYTGRNIGRSLVEFACAEARTAGKNRIVALSTQTVPFFKEKCGFSDAAPEDLPKPLRLLREQSGRRSQVLSLALD